MVCHWSLNHSTSPRVSRTLLCILADLNNAVVWMVSSRPLISECFNPFISLLVTVPRGLITIGITVTFMFLSFFNSLARSWYLSFFSFSFNFTTLSQDSKVHYSAISLFLVDLGLVVWTRLGDPFVSQNPWSCASCSPGQILDMQIPFGRVARFQFLAQFPVDRLAHVFLLLLLLRVFFSAVLSGDFSLNSVRQQMSSGLFYIFKLILIVRWFGWSRFFL